MVLFRGKTCGDAEIVVSLQCVFHSIRFKVNKGLGPSGDPFFFYMPQGYERDYEKSASLVLLF